jgi:hypothetical protein
MSPAFLTAAFLAHIFPTKEPPSDLPEEPDRGDPEKAGASGSGTSGDQAFDADADRDDADQEIEDLDDFEETRGGESVDGTENEGQSGRGVPLTSTGTMSSSSMNTFSRPSLPNWVVKTKEILFGSHQEHEEFIPNYRRAVIISGSLVPFSILLEIPGLTEHWYIRTYGYQIVESHKNPPWIIIALSFSLALAVIANIALVNRFLERRVKRCTIISIIALSIHGNTLPSSCAFIQVEIRACRYTKHRDRCHLGYPASFRRRLHQWRSVLDDHLLNNRIFNNKCDIDMGSRHNAEF